MPYQVEQMLKMTSDQLDDLFVKSTAGDIPDGEGKGTALIAEGTVISPEIAKFINYFGWQRKTFNAKAGLLTNTITPFGIAAIVARVYKGPSLLDGKECIVLDYSETSLVAGWIRDEIRMIEPAFYLGEVFGGKTRLVHFVLQF
jgi:hypothetical protein